MTSLLLLIPVGVILLGVAMIAFVWAVQHGQFDELEDEGASILADDDSPAPDPAEAAYAGDREAARTAASERRV